MILSDQRVKSGSVSLTLTLTRLPTMTNHQTHTVTPKAWAKEKDGKQTPLKLAS